MQLVIGRASAPTSTTPTDAPADTLLRRIQADVRADVAPPGPRCPARRRAAAPRPGRRQPAGPLVPRPGPPGRGPARRDPPPPRRRPDARAARRDRHVPGHRDVRPAHPGHVRRRERRRGRDQPASGLPDLRVRLADRSLRQTNPVLAVVAELLDLADARITASQLLDFASREPVRRRFRLDDDDLARIEEWIAATGIRWGLDAAHRAPYQLDALDANTWRAGLDRLLLGVTMAEDDLRLVGGVLPLDDVDSGDIDLAGRFAELVDRLHAAVAELSPPQPIEAWADAIAAAADALDRDVRPRRLAARRARPDPRRHRDRGRRRRRAGRRRSRSPRCGPCSPTGCGAADPGQLPHRPPHDLHARADAVGAPPRRLPPRPRRRRVPAPHRARRRRHHRARPVRRRPRPPQRGPPAPARRPARRHRPPRHHLQRPRRADQRRPPAGRAARRAARRRRRAPPAPTATAPPGTTRSSSTTRCSRSTRATSRPARSSPTSRGASTPSPSTAPAPRSPVPLRTARVPRPRRSRPSTPTGRARRPRPLRPAPGQGLPPPAPRRLGQRRRRRAGRRAAGRARQPRAVERRRSAPRPAPGRGRRGRLRRRRAWPGRSAAGHARRRRCSTDLLPVVERHRRASRRTPSTPTTRRDVGGGRTSTSATAGRSSAPCRASSATCVRDGDVLPGRRQAPPRRVGAAAGADRGAPRTARSPP